MYSGAVSSCLIYEGIAAAQGNLPGGVNQVYLNYDVIPASSSSKIISQNFIQTKLAHYKARGEKCVQQNAAPNYYVCRYLSKNLKASLEEIQAAVDGVMCANQAEKLRIIRSHMDSLSTCKTNLDSEILTVAEQFLPQMNLVLTVPGVQTLAY